MKSLSPNMLAGDAIASRPRRPSLPRVSARLAAAGLCVAAVLALAAPAAAQTPALERVRLNDNRARAGLSNSNVLVIRLEARLAMWYPTGDDQPGTPIPVFAEMGRQAQVPGPLIRAPGGTDVIVVVHNALPADTITIHGLYSRPAVGAQYSDSIRLAPRAVQTLRFRLDRPGTYYYWGTTKGKAFNERYGEDAQLTGAIVVDEPGERTPRDRIFIIGAWVDSAASELNRHRGRELFVINGRSWPYTDRLVYERGDSVQWRVINASVDPHPMHLHGHYFRVNRRGNGRSDSLMAARDLVNTELVLPGETIALGWRADRLGNWLFHCHIPEHVTVRGALGMPREAPVVLAQAGQLHVDQSAAMGGLVVGIDVRMPEGDTTTVVITQPPPARRVRMDVRPNIGSTTSRPFYGIALDEGAVEPQLEAGQHVGPPLVLNRGEPVSIMVLNRTPEALSMHWHGIELESFYDGVPGFSGIRPNLASEIAPSDSFEVRFTPPRSGTFIYHAQTNEVKQQRAGIVGPLVVVEKGKFDSTRDIPVLVSSPSDSVDEEHAVLINGSLTPVAVTLRPALAHRLRLINITTGRPELRFELRRDTTLVTWRQLAKDGADLPAARRVIHPARQQLAIGETMDFEFFPTRPGTYLLEVRTPLGTLLGTLPIRVQ